MKAADLHSLYSSCTLCPRACRVDRASGARGFCGQGSVPGVAWAGLHFGEEPPITGKRGSGALFFSGCTLKCSFCQNRQISHGGMGSEVSPDELIRILLALGEAGAENINVVTGTPHIPAMLAALEAIGMPAGSRGKHLPIIWNTSGYESPESLAQLSDSVDIYLADLKTLEAELSRRLFAAPDYPRAVRRALPLMLEDRPLAWSGDRLVGGVVVRHLVLPEQLESTRRCLRWYRETLYPDALLSLLFQFTPVSDPAAPDRHWPTGDYAVVLPARGVSAGERRAVLSWLEEMEIEEGFVQELPEDGKWMPDFDRINPFPPDQARTLWHWKAIRDR